MVSASNPNFDVINNLIIPFFILQFDHLFSLSNPTIQKNDDNHTNLIFDSGRVAIKLHHSSENLSFRIVVKKIHGEVDIVNDYLRALDPRDVYTLAHSFILLWHNPGRPTPALAAYYFLKELESVLPKFAFEIRNKIEPIR